MEICTSKSSIRKKVAAFRAAGLTVGLVPTMGYLHAGHMALVKAAAEKCDVVVVSIFVNPTQFGENEDLGSYPRDEARDMAMLKAAGVDAVFMPSPEEMYHPQAQTEVVAKHLSRILIGKIRPVHFTGVATVVTKLLNIVGPDQAFFGEKDFQQLCVIKTMVRDLDMSFVINGVPTVRESDGLAMSSRNVKLNSPERKAAVVLSQSLDIADEMAQNLVKISSLKKAITAHISAEKLAELKTVDIRDAETLKKVRGLMTSRVVVLLAVRFGNVLLIDQREISP